MPILSNLRIAASAGVRSAQALVKKNQQTCVPVRYMGGHKMVLRPSNFPKNRLKDDLIYFLGLGVVPVALITTYVNVRIGPAELLDTPEGYVPEHYEYYKLPVTRFLAKHISNNSPEKSHERTLYYLHKADEKRKLKVLKQKVKQDQEDKKSQKGWYYIPMQSNLETRIKSAEGVMPVQGARDR